MSFDVASFLKDYISDVKDAFPEFADVIEKNYNLETLDVAAECKFFEDTLRPHFMKIMQKDDSLFDEPIEILRGVDISNMWNELASETRESLWKYVRLSIAFSFIGGDSTQQIQSIIGLVKQLWTQQTGKSVDEIDSILNDDKTQSNITELIEAFSKSKIAALVTEMIENIKPEQLGLEDFNITDIQGFVDLLKNPESPILKKATHVITHFLEEKMRVGAITKEELIAEIEGFKARLTGSFGKLIKEAMLGGASGPVQTGETLMSNHPDARRARMLARLQRKQRDKMDGKK